MKSIKIKLLSICLMLFSAIILFSACDLFGGEKDGDGDSNSIGYVSDIYYDGTFFCYEMKDLNGNLNLKSYITINGVQTELEDEFLSSSIDEEVYVRTSSVYDEVRNCNESSFTITAYVENLDGDKKSTEKSVTFDNIIFSPQLNRLTGDITWDIDEKVAGSYIMAQVDWTNRVQVYPFNTTGCFNVYEAFEYFNSPDVSIKMNAKHPDDMPEKNTYYLRKDASFDLYMQTTGGASYNNGKITWYNGDNHVFETELDEVYNLTIVDGEETIIKTITVPYGEEDKREYPYQPKHDNFSVTVTGGIDYEFLIANKPSTYTPVCAGEITDFYIDSRLNRLTWKVKNLNGQDLSDKTFKYDIFQDGTYLLTVSKPEVSLYNFEKAYGNSKISIVPKVDATNCYVCVENLDVFVAKKATIGFGEKTENGIMLTLNNIDENASAYKLHAYWGYYSKIIENVYEGMQFEYIPLEAEEYLYLEPVYEGIDNVIQTSDSSRIEFLQTPELIDVTFEEDGRWYANFNEQLYDDRDVEYLIIIDEVETRYETKSTKMSIALPSILASAEDETEVTLKIRYLQDDVGESSCEVLAEIETFSFKNLPMPSTSWVEDNKLKWDYVTTLDYAGFCVETYKGKPTGTKSLISKKIVQDMELDLSNIAGSGGDYFSCIYAKAKESTLNEIILNGCKNYCETFYIFSSANVYPVDHDNLKIEINSNEKAKKEGVDNFSIRLFAGNLEESKTISIDEKLNLREYANEWNVETIGMEVVVNAKDGYVKSGKKIINIDVSELTGFNISNEIGTVSFDKYLENSTYDFSLKLKSTTDIEFKEILTGSEIDYSDIQVMEAIASELEKAENVDKSYEDFKISIATNYNSKELSGLKNSNSFKMPPKETEFEFDGLTYGVGFKDRFCFSFNFNKELTTDPRITAISNGNISLGSVLASNGQFNYSSLVTGTNTIRFTNNIQDSVLDAMNTFNIPYYHTLNVYSRPDPSGLFRNFVSGVYYYKANSLGNYIIDKDKSIPATVDFYPTIGTTFKFNGKEVSLTNGKYTLNLLESNVITVTVDVQSGLSSVHDYNMYSYSTTKGITFQTVLPPIVKALNISTGILNISVSHFSETAKYSISREYGNDVTREFTTFADYAKDRYDPSENSFSLKFQQGEEVIIKIFEDTDDYYVEAEYIIEYTVP